MLHRVAPVDEAHDVRFRLHNLVTSRRLFALAHVAVAVRRATEDTDLPLSRAVALATARALEDLRPLVLGDHALKLQQQLIFRRIALRRLHEYRLNAIADKLFRDQNFVAVFPPEPVRD